MKGTEEEGGGKLKFKWQLFFFYSTKIRYLPFLWTSNSKMSTNIFCTTYIAKKSIKYEIITQDNKIK